MYWMAGWEIGILLWLHGFKNYSFVAVLLPILKLFNLIFPIKYGWNVLKTFEYVHSVLFTEIIFLYESQACLLIWPEELTYVDFNAIGLRTVYQCKCQSRFG